MHAWIPGGTRDDKCTCIQVKQSLEGSGLAAENSRMLYYVYLLASKKNGTLYVGVTNDIVRRVYEHRTSAVEGFTDRYGVKMLVWFDSTGSVEAAIQKEKQIKNWKRAWKIALIEKGNPQWRDLYPDIL